MKRKGYLNKTSFADAHFSERQKYIKIIDRTNGSEKKDIKSIFLFHYAKKKSWCVKKRGLVMKIVPFIETMLARRDADLSRLVGK